MSYTPDCWVIVKFVKEQETPIYKVLAGWYGGYLGSDRWQLNSGIVRYDLVDDKYVFHGESGSEYHCHRGCEQLSSLTASILENWKRQQKNHPITIEQISIENFVEEFSKNT
jgi:hypothetical protein